MKELLLAFLLLSNPSSFTGNNSGNVNFDTTSSPDNDCYAMPFAKDESSDFCNSFALKH